MSALHNDAIDLIKESILSESSVEQIVDRLVGMAKATDQDINQQILFINKLQLSTEIDFNLSKKNFDRIYDKIDPK